MFKDSIYIERRRILAENMCSGLVLFPGHMESSMNYAGNTYPFRQNSSFLYFFGIDIPDLFAVIDLDNQKTILFGNELTIDDIIWTGPIDSLKERAAKSGVFETKPLSDISDYLKSSLKLNRSVHFLPQSRTDNWLQLSELLGKSLSEIKSLSSEKLIRQVVAQRSTKRAEELEELELAAAIGYEMHITAMRMAKLGVSEQVIAGLIEGLSLSKGRGVSFSTILSQKGEVLHGHDHSGILEAGRFMLCDAGAVSPEYYASDYTRTTPVGGHFNTRQREIYQIVVDANNTARALIQPTIAYRDIHLAACKVLARGLKDVGILKGNVDDAVEVGAHALFMPHGLGHMMGLDVHDMEDLGENFVGYDDEIVRSTQFGLRSLRLGRKLQPGFVLTIEPGLYFMPELMHKWESEKLHATYINYEVAKSYLGLGGIRLEDNIVVTEKSCRIIGKRLPITIDDVEQLF